jgi:hypothetical protein
MHFGRDMFGGDVRWCDRCRSPAAIAPNAAGEEATCIGRVEPDVMPSAASDESRVTRHRTPQSVRATIVRSVTPLARCGARTTSVSRRRSWIPRASSSSLSFSLAVMIAEWATGRYLAPLAYTWYPLW